MRSDCELHRDGSLPGGFEFRINGPLSCGWPFSPCYLLKIIPSPTNSLTHSGSNTYKQSSPTGNISYFKVPVIWMTPANRGKRLPTMAIIHHSQSTIPLTIQGQDITFTVLHHLTFLPRHTTTSYTLCYRCKGLYHPKQPITNRYLTLKNNSRGVLLHPQIFQMCPTNPCTPIRPWRRRLQDTFHIFPPL